MRVCVCVCGGLTCAVCRLRWVVGALRARGDACHEDEHPHLQVCVCLSVCVTPSLPPSLTLSRSPSAVRDGWTAGDFHSKCDGKGATLTLVRSKEGYVFGGYTAVPWSSPWFGYGTCVRVCVSVCTHVCVSSAFKPDPHAFLFTITNAAGLPPAKVKATKRPDIAVFHSSGRLAAFGDLYIWPNAHTEADSFTHWGDAYPLPPGAADNTFLVGGEEVNKYGHPVFKVAALEVFLVVPVPPPVAFAPLDLQRNSTIEMSAGAIIYICVCIVCREFIYRLVCRLHFAFGWLRA